MARNRIKPSVGKTQSRTKTNEPEIKSDFISALEYGMADCTHDFAKAIGVRAKNLRAWKSGRDKPTSHQKETTLAEASKLGWTAQTNTNS
jgi:DNA-binding transcriptional regulator YiaG